MTDTNTATTDDHQSDQINYQKQYNERELCPPAWLNEQLFAHVLSNKHDGVEVQITQCIVQPGTTANEHYATVMFRARIHYTCAGVKHFQSLIIKTMPLADEHGDEFYMGETTIFETEIKMYKETLPRIMDILRKYNDDTKLCADLLYSSLSPHKCIILADLVELGYTTITGRWLSIEEVQAALMKLAKIHAVSYKLASENIDDPITQYASSPFANMNVHENVMYRDAVKNFIALLSRHEDLAVYVPHFERLGERLVHNCMNLFDQSLGPTIGARAGHINVLNHGDFHMKNMMLRRNPMQNTLEDLMLIDYQFCYYGSVGIDLCYAIIMLFSPEMRCTQRDDLIHYYTIQFQQTLQRIAYTQHIPSEQEIKEELHRLKHGELFMFIVFLIFNYVFATADGDVSKTVQDEKYRQKLVERSDFLNELRILLPRYLQQGYFDD